MKISRVQMLLLLLTALLLPACGARGALRTMRRKITAGERQPQVDARKITVAVVQSKSLTIKHDYVCTAYGQYCTEIRAPADGYLAEVSIKEGQTVKKGDPLFKIRSPGDKELKPDDRDRAASAEVGRAVVFSDPLFRLRPPENEEKPKADNQDGVISIKSPSDGVIARLTHSKPGCVVVGRDDL